jgi:hypothetical protein
MRVFPLKDISDDKRSSDLVRVSLEHPDQRLHILRSGLPSSRRRIGREDRKGG